MTGELILSESLNGSQEKGYFKWVKFSYIMNTAFEWDVPMTLIDLLPIYAQIGYKEQLVYGSFTDD